MEASSILSQNPLKYINVDWMSLSDKQASN